MAVSGDASMLEPIGTSWMETLQKQSVLLQVRHFCGRVALRAYLTPSGAFPGFGSEDGDIWIGINTDGVRVYRRGKKGAWPVWAINFNLPPSQRYKLKNLMLLGLYFGEDKPLMADFLKPLFRNLAERATVPFAVKFNGKPDPVLCRTQVIACPLDMDARVRRSCPFPASLLTLMMFLSC